MKKSLFRFVISGALLTLPFSAYALDQWASKVLDFSNQYSVASWSANQVLNAPDVFEYADNRNAWTTSSPDIGEQYLTLGFQKPVYATGVTIRQTYGFGFVTRVETIDTKNVARKVWEGIDNSLPNQINNFKATWTPTSYLVKAVKIYVNTDIRSGYEEIDAVRLHGFEGFTGTIAPYFGNAASLKCTNNTTRKSVTATLRGTSKKPVTAWDCSEAGLGFKKGDSVTIQITGKIAQ
jgi:hypothetical protein